MPRPRLTVNEASVAFIRAMRNPLSGDEAGVCRTCRTFVDPEYDRCFPCVAQADDLDAVVPITYSEHLGQMHTALRRYKDGSDDAQRFARVRLMAILWRFLDAHEDCVARAAGVREFDLVTTVPSSTPERDEARTGLRQIVEGCRPVADRYERVLRATGDVPQGRDYSRLRYEAEWRIDGVRALLIDDTWTRGGHAQSAAYTLREAGASSVALVVIGRHFHREWEVVRGEGVTNGDRFDELPPFDWATCAAE